MNYRSGQGVFFLLWPLFARAPRHWFLEIFLLSAPGVQSVFFLLRSVVALRRAPRPFGGARAKKKHHPGCFFFAPAPGKGRGRRSPIGRRHGARAKKKTPRRVFFFAAAPRGRSLTHCGPGWRCLGPAGPQQKKKHPGWCFFLLRPRADAHSLTAGLGGDASARRGHSKKKKHPGWCFFFLQPRADAHSLTAGLGGDASARRGQSKKTKKPGCCFFFCCGPAADFLDNSKKCLGYYIGSKKARRGHSKKKHHFRSGPV